MTSSFLDRRTKALEVLSQGDAQQAFGVFRWVFEHPGQLEADRGRWADALEILSRIAVGVGATRVAEQARVTATRVDDTRALYDLGYLLIEEALHGIAATVLSRAHELSPNDAQIISELVCAFEGAGLNRAACDVMRRSWRVIEGQYLFHYLLAFDALMTCDRLEPQRQLQWLEQASAALPADAELAALTARLRSMLLRARAIEGVCRLDDRDLRGWHFVVNGALLLHRSPYGLDEGMNGRYAFTQDSEARCHAALRDLASVLDAWKRPPPCVFALEERESSILAHAASTMLGVPVRPWRPDGGPGLIVAYDLQKLDVPMLESLFEHRPGQLLFAHAECWTTPPAFAADVVAYLHQVNESPWGARMTFDPETKAMTRRPAETAPASELAARVVAATPSDEDGGVSELPTVLRMATAISSVPEHAGAFRQHGPRARHRTDSPVKSSRFL